MHLIFLHKNYSKRVILQKGSEDMNWLKAFFDMAFHDIKKDPIANLWVPMKASVVTNVLLYLWLWS